MYDERIERADARPPRSTSRGSGKPRRAGAITLFVLVALVTAWSDSEVRRLLLIGLASYVVMRVWSGIYFIPEMLAFQKVPLDSAPSAELAARVSKWTFWTWFREPLDILSFLCWLLAFGKMK